MRFQTVSDVAVLDLCRSMDQWTMDDLLVAMETVDRLSDDDDGFKHFNWLYWQVTQRIRQDCAGMKWQSPQWLDTLVVVFGRLYFEGRRQCIMDPDRAPLAWLVMHERRSTPGVSRVQYGLAGMSAHINRDLLLAVLAACDACGIPQRWWGPEHRDFLRVNKILDEIEITAMQAMATGVIRDVCRRIEPFDRIIAMTFVSRARDLAWANATIYRALRGSAAQAMFLRGVDEAAAQLGKALLVPTELPLREISRTVLRRRAGHTSLQRRATA